MLADITYFVLERSEDGPHLATRTSRWSTEMRTEACLAHDSLCAPKKKCASRSALGLNLFGIQSASS